jgi:hypothetical protein
MPQLRQCIVVLGICISNPTVHILKAKSRNFCLAVAVPAPKLNSSTVRHCFQPKSAKKPDQGTVAWLWPCLHKSKIEFQMSMAEYSMINCCRPYARYNEQGLLLCWNFITSSPELKPNRITDDEDKN